MSVVKALMATAIADVELLRKLDGEGDDFSIPRDVDFLLRAPSAQKAELVRDFVNDHHYGKASVVEESGEFSVRVVIHTPIQQNIIGSLSGFVACLCAIYGLEYDGWGCVTTRPM